MRLSKNKKWEVTANPNDLVGFLHELEHLLVEYASPIGNFQLKSYFVGAKNAENHHNVSAEDLLDVIASLSHPLSSLKAEYLYRDPETATNYSASLWAFANNRLHREARVDLTLGGPMTDEADKAFETILRRLTREIGRRNRGVPLPPPLSQAVDAKPTAAPVGENRDRSRTFMGTLTTQPLPVALFSSVVGAIVGGGVVLLIGMLISNHQNDDRPTTPPPSPSQTPTTTQSTARLPTSDGPAPPRPSREQLVTPTPAP